MQHVCGVDVFEAAKDLVDEILVVTDSKALFGGNDLMKVCVHEVIDDVDGIELGLRGMRRQNVTETEDVVMLEMAQ